MLRVGLTGGIGSGKTTVAGLFNALGVPVIDADTIAHTLTQPGTEATAEIFSAFGPEIADGDKINRSRLAERVFADPAARQRLETILHPRIRKAIQDQLKQLKGPYCVLVIPLLLETRQQDLVDRILVVDAEEQTQIQRVMERDGRSENEVWQILQAQVSREERLAVADDCLENDGDLEQLKSRVQELHEQYLKLSANQKGP